MIKFILYILVAIITAWSMDSININSIFKKNEFIKARIVYILFLISIIYLVTNFIYDFVYLKLL